MAFVINAIAPVDSRDYMYFDMVEPVLSTASSPARFATLEASLCQELLPGR